MSKTLEIKGRIDSNNIEEIENNLLKEVQDYDGEIILDAKDLEYISSVGLRMILKIKKLNNNTKVINCNREVYEIFEMTGFTDMMDISKAFRTISIDDCEIIGDGFYGTVYRIDPETIVKVYKNKNSLEMVQREKELSRKAFVLGIPTAIPYDIVKVNDTYGAVFELLNCKSLDTLIKEGIDIKSLSKECVEILKKMHSTEVDTNDLPNRKDKILEEAEGCRDLLDEKTYKSLIKFINDIEDKTTMIHGDFQIKNLMKQDDEILTIDMDTLSYGNPIFEFSALYASYVAFACVNKNNPYEFLGVPYETTKKIWEYIYNDYFDDKTEKEKEEYLEKIKILSFLQVLYIRSKFRNENNPYQDEEIEYAKNYLINNLPKEEKINKFEIL